MLEGFEALAVQVTANVPVDVIEARKGVRLLGVSTSVVVVVVDIEVVVPAFGESSVAGVAGVGVLAAGAGVTGRTVVGDTGGSSRCCCCCCCCIVSRGLDFDFDFGLSMNGSGTG